MGKEFDQAAMLSKFKGEIELILKTRNNPRDFLSVGPSLINLHQLLTLKSINNGYYYLMHFIKIY